MVQPINYLGLTPQIDLGQSLAQGLMNGEAIQAARQRREMVKEKVLAAREAREEDARYQEDVQNYLQNPTPASMSALISKYPSRHEALSKSWDVQDEAQRRSELALAGNIYAAALNGSPLLGADLMDKRIEADIAAGRKPDQVDIAVSGMLRSGDEEQIRRAQAILGFGVAAMAGPEKFVEAFVNRRRDAKVVGDALVDPETGQEIYVAKGEQWEPVYDGGGSVVAQRNTKTGKIAEDPRAPKSPLVTVNTGNSLGDQVGKNFANEVHELAGKAQDAVNSIETVRHAKGLVGAGIISGAGAEWRLNAARALSAVTGMPIDSVTNTEDFLSSTAKLVAENIKQFGAGSGLSDADRNFVERMVGGKITLTPQAIQRILGIREKVSRSQVDLYNRRRGDLIKAHPELAPYYPQMEIPKDPFGQGGSAKSGAGQSGVPRIRTDADYAKLPSGAEYIAPDGTRRRKP